MVTMMANALFVLSLACWAVAGAAVVNASVGVLWRVSGVVSLLLLAFLVLFSGYGTTVQFSGVVLGVLVGVVVAVGRAIYARVGKARRTEWRAGFRPYSGRQ